MDPVTGMAIGSALVSAYGQYKSSQAQAEAQQQQAKLNFLKAEEVLARNEINNDLLLESALVHQGTQVAQIAGSGVDVGGQTQKRVVAETMRKAQRQIELNTRAAEWESRMIRIGAESQIQSSEEIALAGTISSIGSLGFNTATTLDSKPSSNYKKD